ncbi:hypothetical protein DPEC_G00173660, partial [Dallia pectoralis]
AVKSVRPALDLRAGFSRGPKRGLLNEYCYFASVFDAYCLTLRDYTFEYIGFYFASGAMGFSVAMATCYVGMQPVP